MHPIWQIGRDAGNSPHVRDHWDRWFERHGAEKQRLADEDRAAVARRRRELELLYEFGGL